MSAGFSYTEVCDMTIAQVNFFSKVAVKQMNKRMLNDVVSSLAGARYDENSLKKLFESLDP